MHELVLRINEPALCYIFARNAERQGRPELAVQAYRRAVDLRAEQHPAESEIERVAVRAIYAYEEAMSYAKGRRTRATGTWQLVNRHGVVQALSKRLQSRSSDAVDTALRDLGMADYSFEAVRATYPDLFDQASAA